MATAGSIWSGIVLFFVGIFISIILFLSVAYPAEKVITQFETTTMFSGGGGIFDVPAPWNMGYTDALRWMQILYIVCTLPAILGTLRLFMSAIQTQSYDLFGTDPEPVDQIPLETSNAPQYDPRYDSQVTYKKGGLF